jgi:hypothetical protein
MTTTTIPYAVPLRKPKAVTPADPFGRAAQLKQSIESVFNNGFWYCQDGDHLCEREEGEQGQPAHCNRCGSHRITWFPPVPQALTP